MSQPGNNLRNPAPNPYKPTGTTNQNQPRQPNLTRPTLVICNGAIVINTAGDDGSAWAYSDSSPTNPSTEVAHARGLITGATGRIPFAFTFIVAPGDYYQFGSTVQAGAPSVNFFVCQEVTL